jgi:hypothetical protein
VEKQEDGAQVERKESDADRGPEELPDPDREGPSPDQENESEDSEPDRSAPAGDGI